MYVNCCDLLGIALLVVLQNIQMQMSIPCTALDEQDGYELFDIHRGLMARPNSMLQGHLHDSVRTMASLQDAVCRLLPTGL